MDNGADRYLHKKFKKQLSIEPHRTKQLINNNHTLITQQQPPQLTNNINTIIINNNNNNNNRVPTITTTVTNNNDNNSTNSVVVQNCVKSSISRGDNDILVCSEQRKSSTDISYGSSSNLRSDESVLNLKQSLYNLNETVFSPSRNFNSEDLNRNENHVYNSNHNDTRKEARNAYNQNQSENLKDSRISYSVKRGENHNDSRNAYGDRLKDALNPYSVKQTEALNNPRNAYNANQNETINDSRNAYNENLSDSRNAYNEKLSDTRNAYNENLSDTRKAYNENLSESRSAYQNENLNDPKNTYQNENLNDPKIAFSLHQNENQYNQNEYNLSQSENEEVKHSDGQSSILYSGEEEKQEGKSGGGGKYVCTYCNLACSKPSVLQKHIRAHTNERPYPCVSCGFSFKTRSNLYKHCRSRSHANRVMGHKAREMVEGEMVEPSASPPDVAKEEPAQPVQNKPYKPRFHTAKFFDENTENNQSNSERISTRINELIDKNNSIVNKTDHCLLKRRPSIVEEVDEVKDEPLNLTSKSRKRCLSEVSEPAVQKSLIKELLLKNYADTNMQCPHCKMIFQTVTELELHKMRNCKGMTKTGARYSRSSSVNVASILTQNKNAFDNIHQVFPLKSPGPFLGKTRLVDSDKTKSFSYEDVIEFPSGNDLVKTTQRYSLSPLTIKKAPVKLFGGEVKIAQSTGDAKNFKIDGKEREQEVDYNKTENHVVKATLQTGGTILQNKKPEPIRSSPEIIRVYENQDRKECLPPNGVATYENSYNYTNLMDFSQKAARMLAPNLHHQLNVAIPGLPIPAKYAEPSSPLLTLSTPPPAQKNKILTSPVIKMQDSPSARMQELTISQPVPNGNITNPMNLLYNGKVVRYVPGIPGPVQPFEPSTKPRLVKPDIMITPVAKTEEIKPEKQSTPSPTYTKPLVEMPTPKKFARPNSLALKPSMANLKQHHGLTPTMFNQILISPDTPRGAKKYNEHFLHGNYFSYLGLKSSTKPVYCTLNKTQPFYVPHFKKLSMYSEWRQQDQKTDKYYASAYDSRQRPPRRFTIAGKYNADYIVHSSYKFTISEVASTVKEETPKSTSILGGYESYEDYTYIRGRDECSTRQQEHEAAYGLLSLSQKPSSTVSTISDPIISPMSVNSADCSTPTTPSFINAEQLAQVSKTSYAKNKILDQQKPTTFNPSLLCNTITTTSATMTTRENLGLANPQRPLMYPYTNLTNEVQPPQLNERMEVDSPKSVIDVVVVEKPPSLPPPQQERQNIIHFNVIKRYNPQPPPQNYYNRSTNEIIDDDMQNLHRKRKHVNMEAANNYKLQKSDSSSEVMDLSMPQEKQQPVAVNGSGGDADRGKKAKSYYNDEGLTPQNVAVYRSGGENVQVDKDNNRINVNYVVQESSGVSSDVPKNWIKTIEYDNSAMETLADIATKQEKLEKNSVAKNVATEFLKLATKNEYPNGDDKGFLNSNKEINDLVVKSEENKSCTICSKNFSKPSQLRLHMNIHYLERPFKCESCAVSFRTKGHLQKHERSAGHHNKLSSSPALSSSEPRPFKCSDCNIAFRIHGHLAKHLRSKMHIMKLECLAKIPFGLYAELERSNSLLTEINTADGDQCLDSLKLLAKKVFINDPSKLNQLEEKSVDHPETDTDS